MLNKASFTMTRKPRKNSTKKTADSMSHEHKHQNLQHNISKLNAAIIKRIIHHTKGGMYSRGAGLLLKSGNITYSLNKLKTKNHVCIN